MRERVSMGIIKKRKSKNETFIYSARNNNDSVRLKPTISKLCPHKVRF